MGRWAMGDGIGVNQFGVISSEFGVKNVKRETRKVAISDSHRPIGKMSSS